MGWQDRSYYRDSSQGAGNPLMWLLTGSVPLFTVFGIRVQAHAMLILYAALVLLFGLGQGFYWQDRLLNVGALFVIVLLHEFGHCFAARSVRGEANEIVMHPLGGLALATPPRRPWPTFVTVAGGPAVNVLICLACGVLLFFTLGWLPWNPVHNPSPGAWQGWLDVSRYAYWIYQISWMLLVFNLMPIFPLDGGQMLQSILWPKFGYYKSMNFALITGMVGCGIGAAVGLATGSLMLVVLFALLFVGNLQARRQLLAEGPWGFQEDEDAIDYSASLFTPEPKTAKHKKLSKRVIRKAQKREEEEAAEQERVDRILAKVSTHGMHSLTWWEKRTLRRATDRQRKRDLELKAEMTRKGF
jgi:stage IV sporulation protein FB